MSRRPAGVVIVVVLLGLGALLLTVLALGTGIMAFAAPHLTIPGNGVTPPPAGLMAASMLFATFLYLALAGWSSATMVGLLRMRTWARISAMVIGGALVFFSLLGILGIAAARAALPSMQLPPNADPAALKSVFAMMVFFNLGVAAVGVWWLVYFALRSTRDAFRNAQSTAAPRPQYIPQIAYPAQPRGPFTDFSVAQPLPPPASQLPEDETKGTHVVAEPVAGAWPPVDHAAPAPQHFVAEPVVPHGRRPVTMTVVAVLLLIGSFLSLVQMASPAPLFFMSVLLSGWPAHLTMLVLCAVSGVSGLGILKLQKPAWMLAMGLFCLYTLNGLSVLLPGGRARFSGYMHTVMTRSAMGMPVLPFGENMMFAFAITGAAIAIAFGATMLFLLWRARAAFVSSVEDHAEV